MANYKVSNRGDFTTVTYRQKEALQVNQREMGLLDRGQIAGFMKPRWDMANEMSFLAPTCVPLKKYLAKEGTLDKIYNVFDRIIGLIYQVGNNQLMIQNLLVDVNYVFVRPMSNDVFMIYEPYITNKPQPNILAFFMQIISLAKIKDKGQQMQLQQFGAFVSSHTQLDELERYVKQMQRGSSQQMLENSNLGYRNPATASVNMQNGYGNVVEEGTTVLGYEDEGTTVLNQTTLSETEFAEPETTVLRREPIVTLIRTKDGTSFVLSGVENTIGRAIDNDVAIRDNTDVSRYHAIITKNGEAYTVADRGSKNGTVLNGLNLAPNMPEMIQNGDSVVFGGEEFTFVVEE